MSFRELRNFTECMRSLGYPRMISMENFRNPNFELVADCLDWLVQRYDPGADIADDISTESDRVFFLKSVAQVMQSKARIKLNLKRLYSADGLAVKELLKIAQLLYQATAKADTEEQEDAGVEFNLSTKAFDVKMTRQLASEITQKGAQMYDSLGFEAELRDSRTRAINRNMDIEEIEQQVNEQIGSVQENVSNIERMMVNLEKDEKSLEAKIEKRRNELERSEKRLSTLQAVRPAYMDEYEKVQADLQQLYVVYLERFRNLEYLENELETYNREEQEKAEEHDKLLKKMQKRMRAEEMRILRGEQDVNEDDLEFDDGSPSERSKPMSNGGGRGGAKVGGKASKGNIPSSITRVTADDGGRGGGGGNAAVMGSLMGGGGDGSEDDLSDGGSEDGSESTHVSIADGELSDDLIDDDDDDEDDDDDDDEMSDVDEDDDDGSSDNEF